MSRFDFDRAQSYIALSLRLGSLISTLTMVLGLGLLLVRAAAFSVLPGTAGVPFWETGVSGVALAVMRGGILLLLLTPIFRIVVASVGFALERDRKYALISLGVLAVVLGSIGISFAS